MSNEEFLNMIKNEIQKAHEKSKKGYEHVEMLKRIDPNSEQSKGADYYYMKDTCNSRALEGIENLPAYTRINVMSEVELEELRKQKPEFYSMTSDEIKIALKNAVPNSYFYGEMIEKAKEPISEFTALEAEASLTSERAYQLAGLMTQHKIISDSQMQIKGRANCSYYLPEPLQEKLKHSSYYDYATGYVSNPDRLMETVQEIERTFEEAKITFDTQFTREKLYRLMEESSDVKFTVKSRTEALKLHADKLDASALENLQNLVERRDKLSKKIFKGKKTKQEIESLNTQIEQEQSKMCQEIRNWYYSQAEKLQNILGINYASIRFSNSQTVEEYLKSCIEKIEKSSSEIADLKSNIQKAKEEMEQQYQNYEAQKNDIIMQIKACGGENFKNINIDGIRFSNNLNDNLNSIASAPSYINQQSLINEVMQEAQRQADIKEAELRGITVEELMQMRKQENTVEEQRETENEEISQGIRR